MSQLLLLRWKRRIILLIVIVNCDFAETKLSRFPDSKVHGANMGPIWGRQDPGGPIVGPMNFAIWVTTDWFLNIVPYLQMAIFSL